jgi:TPP-dependent indolepyruvate ferredoxin oxidoreductase alpha subunit
MLNDEIREILRSIPAVLVVEDGRPAYVITEYEAWKTMAAGEQVRVHSGRPGNLSPQPAQRTAEPQEAQVLERLNKEILSLREQIQMQEEAVPGQTE